MTKEFRVEIKVKNNNILKKIEEAGYKSVGEFCRLNNQINWASTIGELVNLKKSPLNSKGEFIPTIWKICEILKCIPDELFSETQLNTALESNKRTLEVNEAEMRFMLESTKDVPLLEEQVSADRLPAKIDELLETLTPREAKIIKLRFGLNEMEPQSLDDIARTFDVSRARIKQIEEKALRRLRHPSRARMVKEDYLGYTE